MASKSIYFLYYSRRQNVPENEYVAKPPAISFQNGNALDCLPLHILFSVDNMAEL